MSFLRAFHVGPFWGPGDGTFWNMDCSEMLGSKDDDNNNNNNSFSSLPNKLELLL